MAGTDVAVQEQINTLLQPNSKELEMRWDGGQVYLGEPQETGLNEHRYVASVKLLFKSES